MRFNGRFIVLRYAGILATLTSLFYTAVQTRHCEVAVLTSQSGAALVNAAAGIVFVYRVTAAWGDNILVYSVLSFFWVLQLGAWVRPFRCETAIECQ